MRNFRDTRGAYRVEPSGRRLSALLRGIILAGLLATPWANAHALNLFLPGLVRAANETTLDNKFEPGDFDTERFRGLLEQLSHLMVPLYTDGGNTTGALGFEAGIGWSLGTVTNDNESWEKTTRNSSNSVGVFGIGLRKGMPWASELGLYLSNLEGSSMWAFGLELEASPVDGLAHIPDISVASGIGTTTGMGDMNMLMVSNRVTVSKSFAPSSTVALIPFAGYQGIFVRGFISALLSSELNTDNYPWKNHLPPATIGWVNRGFGGVRGLFGPVNTSLAAGMSNVGQRFTFEVGLSY